MENRKLFSFGLLAAAALTAFALVLVSNLVLAEDEGSATEVEDVNEVEFTEVPSDVGKFGLIGTITAVNAEEKTIAVNGVTVDVSEAKIVGWRWKKLAENTTVKPWKEWWQDWTKEDLKVGDKVRVGGKIQNGKLIAKLVVLHAWRIAEKVKQCEVDTDCLAVPTHLQDKFEMKCVESKCKLVKMLPEAEEEEEEEEEEEVGTTRAKGLQEVHKRIQEILERIKDIQSRIGTAVGSAM